MSKGKEKPCSDMIDIETFRQFALSLPGTDQAKHFEVVSFRVKKKIFATLNAPEQRATLRFSLEDQDVFSAISQGAVYPVPNKWGKYGWTHVNLQTAAWDLCRDAIQCAWCTVAPPKLLAQHPELDFNRLEDDDQS
jgi:hypothetical protein